MNAYQLFDLLHDQHFTQTTNLSYPMKQVLVTLRKYFFDNGFSTAVSIFRVIRGVPFSTLLTKWGLCLNFNLQPMESLLHTDKYLKHQGCKKKP